MQATLFVAGKDEKYESALRAYIFFTWLYIPASWSKKDLSYNNFNFFWSRSHVNLGTKWTIEVIYVTSVFSLAIGTVSDLVKKKDCEHRSLLTLTFCTGMQ